MVGRAQAPSSTAAAAQGAWLLFWLWPFSFPPCPSKTTFSVLSPLHLESPTSLLLPWWSTARATCSRQFHPFGPDDARHLEPRIQTNFSKDGCCSSLTSSDTAHWILHTQTQAFRLSPASRLPATLSTRSKAGFSTPHAVNGHDCFGYAPETRVHRTFIPSDAACYPRSIIWISCEQPAATGYLWRTRSCRSEPCHARSVMCSDDAGVMRKYCSPNQPR